MRSLLLLSCLLLAACRSPHRDYATARYAGTFAVDDLSDGFVAQPGIREGERPDPYRGYVGWRRRYGQYGQGVQVFAEAGRENRHIMGVNVGVEVPLN